MRSSVTEPVLPAQATGRRESRLRREFADLYPGVPPDPWRPVQEMVAGPSGRHTRLMDPDR